MADALRHDVRSARDADVERAVEAFRSAGGPAYENIVRSMYRAVYAYRDTHNPAVLEQFADDAVLTAELREMPEYVKALESSPSRPSGPGRSAADVRAEVLSRRD